MNSTVDKLAGLSRKLNVEIPAEKVQQAFERVYKGIQKKANIKGFRAGKAPIATIKSLYSEQVKSDVVNEGLSVLLLAEPVDWAGQPVTLVIGIAAHGRRYITLLSQLATALLDDGRATSLREATTADRVRALLAS